MQNICSMKSIFIYILLPKFVLVKERTDERLILKSILLDEKGKKC